MNQIDLVGQSAIVTGGAQGFGRAIAERLAASGASVAIWDRNHASAAATATAIGPRVSALSVDVASFDAVQAATAETLAIQGRIDILVNNAGIAGPVAPLWETGISDWSRILEINLGGVFNCCKAIAPEMIRQGYGRIVNIASIAGKEGNLYSSPYSASKAGVIALTKTLGKELAEHDISVNAVTPAGARTAILDSMSEDRIAFLLSKIPRGRFLETGELAALVAWLSSRECSFATGAIYDLSGGRATY